MGGIKNCSFFGVTDNDNDNYIIAKYGTETTYEANVFKNDDRQIVDHIKYKDNVVDLTESFSIEANTTIEIYFSEPIASVAQFFNINMDGNVKNIAYIDLSHFDSSSVEDTQYMFYGCSSLEEINFNNFKTSKVTKM